MFNNNSRQHALLIERLRKQANNPIRRWGVRLFGLVIGTSITAVTFSTILADAGAFPMSSLQDGTVKVAASRPGYANVASSK